jgi:hypothetical protein
MALLRAAVKSRRLDEKFFPEKEDAFDFPAQRAAVSSLAAEWVAANDFRALEDVAEAARTRRIRFPMANGCSIGFISA